MANPSGLGTSTGLVPVVRMYDPAIDHFNPANSETWNRYVLTREPKLFHELLKPDERPTIFHLRKATRAGCRYIRNGATEADQNERAFAVCCVKVQGLHTEDGRRADKDLPETRGAGPMPDSALEIFGEDDIQEIGAVARRLSFLAPGQPAHYLPPATSWAAVRALTYRPAEQTSDASTSDSPPSSE